MAVRAVPDGYYTVTPYLVVQGAARALEFYKQAFGATELMRIQGPDGRVGHAEIRVGNSVIMLSDENAAMGARGPRTLGGSPISILLYMENVDDRVAKALAAGAKLVRPVQDQFYGDRSGIIEDPFGHVWTIATHIEDIAPDEMERRAAEFMKQHGAG
jgi:PhnB protein